MPKDFSLLRIKCVFFLFCFLMLLYFTTNIINVVSGEQLANQKGAGGAMDGPDWWKRAKTDTSTRVIEKLVLSGLCGSMEEF